MQELMAKQRRLMAEQQKALFREAALRQQQAREQQAAIAMIAALALYQGGSLWRARTS